MSTLRKRHNRELKLKVVFDVFKGDRNLSQLSSEYGIHPSQIKEWKDQALKAMRERFSQRRGRKKRGGVEERQLFEEIGRLKIELDFLKGKLGN